MKNPSILLLEINEYFRIFLQNKFGLLKGYWTSVSTTVPIVKFDGYQTTVSFHWTGMNPKRNPLAKCQEKSTRVFR